MIECSKKFPQNSRIIKLRITTLTKKQDGKLSTEIFQESIGTAQNTLKNQGLKYRLKAYLLNLYGIKERTAKMEVKKKKSRRNEYVLKTTTYSLTRADAESS